MRDLALTLKGRMRRPNRTRKKREARDPSQKGRLMESRELIWKPGLANFLVRAGGREC